MISIEDNENIALANHKVILAGIRTNLLYPDGRFSKIHFCASIPGTPCVCTPGSISKIRRECLECSHISDLDRSLLKYDLLANPAHGHISEDSL